MDRFLGGCVDQGCIRDGVEVDVNAPNSIHSDPLLAEVFELLHRMTKSQDQVLGFYAWGAIKKLEQYERQQKAIQQLIRGK